MTPILPLPVFHKLYDFAAKWNPGIIESRPGTLNFSAVAGRDFCCARFQVINEVILQATFVTA
jgi:hypothetical protein